MFNRREALALGLVVVLAAVAPAGATDKKPRTVFLPEDYIVGSWWLYKSVFIEDGRVVDRSNGNITHSEGQGYGMLLAVASNDREAFDALWSWSRENLYVRGDELAAWRWDPTDTPHVADPNNASDGDLLIAWALARASRAWNDPALLDQSRRILAALSEKAVIKDPRYGHLLLPAAKGFTADDQPDGPVVNLSYWVFPALEELEDVDETFPARALVESGTGLLEKARFGASQMPADWISLKGEFPRPAQKFAPNFGYEAVRIPLYAAWSSSVRPAVLAKIHDRWNANGHNSVQVIELATAASLVAMPDPGYRAVSELLSCNLGKRADVSSIMAFEPTEYYPSTLHLMSIIAISERYPQCLASLN